MQFEMYVNNIGLLSLVPVVLLIILTLWGVFTSSGRRRTLSLLGFLMFLSVLASQLVLNLTRLNILSSIDWALWGVYVDFGMMGFYMFLILLYAIIFAFPDFFNARKWIFILPLIGAIIYWGLMVGALAFSSLYETAWLATGLVLVILYMILIPLYATFQYTRQDRNRGSPKVIWTWVILLGGIIWAIGLAYFFGGWLLMLPGYASFFSQFALTIVSLFTTGWFLILIGFIFQRRAG
jgi:hypothetical protein